jgi:hypothetical protein
MAEKITFKTKKGTISFAGKKKTKKKPKKKAYQIFER